MRPQAASRTRPRLAGPTIACFVLVLAGLACLPLRGAVLTNSLEFENRLPTRGSWQWETNQRANQQRQDLYRKRVQIPDAMGASVPRAPTARLINGVAPPRVQSAPSDAPGRFFNLICFTAIVGLTGVLFARKFAPEILADLGQRYNLWAVPRAGERGLPACVRAEEEPFGKFLAALQAGPRPLAPAGTADDAAPHGEFYARAKQLLAGQRTLLHGLRREAGDSARKKLLVDLYFAFGSLKDEAGFPEVLPVWRVVSALEGLLKELVGKIRNTTPSTLRTIEGGLDLLDRLCAPGLNSGGLTGRPFKFLVVDDELISRHALSLSLKKAFSEPDLAVDGPTALDQTTRQAYDVIFLDVQMPGMDGFELCKKIHEAGPNRATPVVFVTNHSDFEARAKSTLVGGNDLMAKPFLIFEITAKALILACQGRLLAHESNPAGQIEPARPAAEPAVPAPAPARGAPAPAVAGRLPAPIRKAGTSAATEAFLERAFQHLEPLRELGKGLLETGDVAMRQNLLTDGFLRINSLTANAREVTHPAYQLCAALEGLVRKLLQDSTRATPSALATVATAVDLLDDLCAPGLKADLAVNPPIRLLVVDDDLVARRALAGALQTVFEKPANAGDGEAALALAVGERYDVIFLDLQMPGMDGFETCSKIREAGCNQETPVVFVTGRTDYAARAEALRTPGTDLVEKPFLTAEINLKALTFALRGRLQPATPAFAD